MNKFFTLCFLSLLISFNQASAGTIYWVGTTGNYSDGANWNTQSNGSGTSGAPINTDDIVIDRNATITIDGTFSPSSLWIVNNAVVNFTNTAASFTYTIGGSITVSPAFKIEAGSTLNVQGTAAIVLQLALGNLAEISGILDITGTSSRMTYAAGGITVVKNGGKIRYGGSSSNGAGTVNSLIMENGSTYEVYKNGGSFPTGTYFEGSLVLNTGAVANMCLFSMNSSVGSYGNYEFNSPGYIGTTSGFNQNITVHDFTLTDDGIGNWVFSTSPATTYTFHVTGKLTQLTNTTIDINRAASGTQETVLRVDGDIYADGIITESNNNTGAILEMGGLSAANCAIYPTTLTNDVSFRVNKPSGINIISDYLFLPNSANAKLILASGNIDVLLNTKAVFVLNPDPAAIVGGTVNSHIIGKLNRVTNQTAAYAFPVSDNAAQIATATITPNDVTPTSWEVTFIAPNPNAGSGLTPGQIEMVTPYYWDISRIFTPLQANASNISFDYSGLTSSTVLIPAQLKILHWNGSSWTSLGGSTSAGTITNTLGSTGAAAPGDPVTTFSPFALGGILGTLPVTIEYFTGKKTSTANLLTWKVNCTNTPTVTMTVERSNDGRNYQPIHNITADEVRCRQAFNYTDAAPGKGMNYYRLRVTDADGKAAYSKIIGLISETNGLSVVNIFPNPVEAASQVTLNLASAEKTNISIVVLDKTGRVMLKKQAAVIAGSNQVAIPVEGLAKGNYVVNIITDAGKTISTSLIKL
ncbi:MAG: T9SS type A sorting domain-containing protein [Ferruginibacter sp.]